MKRLSLMSLGLLFAGCPDREVSKVDPDPQAIEEKRIPINVKRELDLLFVIDSSGSMAGEQASLAQDFPAFMTILKNIDGGLPDLHMAVVTPDMGAPLSAQAISGCGGNGDNGAFQLGSSGCSQVNGQFLSDVANGASRTTNYTGELEDAFACMAQVGVTGCGLEAHLNAARAAIENNTASGFLRDTAFLAVVFIADEDDCSVDNGAFYSGDLSTFNYGCFREGVTCANEPSDPNSPAVLTDCVPNDNAPNMPEVQDIVDYFRSVKPSARQLLAAAIVGPRDPVATGERPEQMNRFDVLNSCPDGTPAGQAAYPAVRIGSFVDSLGGTVTSICEEDLTPALTEIGKALAIQLGSPCIAGDLADTDPDTAGLQPDCAFAYVQNPDSTSPTSTVIPQCNSGSTNTPCWNLVEDAQQCAQYPSRLTVAVQGSPATLPPNTYLEGECLLNAN